MIPIVDNYALRHWREDDAPGIVRYANNPKIAANLRDGFVHPYGLEDAARFLEMAMAKDPQTFFAIVQGDENNDEVIGAIGMAMGVDVHRYTAEMGYWLGEPFWGKGIMTRAVLVFTGWAFAHLDVIRIVSTPYSYNPASARVLEKAGFALEGRMTANVIKNGKVLDQLVYARVSEENARRLGR